MPATLKVTHKAIGAEVRRGPYEVVVDAERAGSVEMNHTIEIPVVPGRHTLQVRNGRNSSSTQTFDAAEEETVAFRCTGKRFLPIFLASFGTGRGHIPPGLVVDDVVHHVRSGRDPVLQRLGRDFLIEHAPVWR
jgi:hypothetical protein